MRRSARERAFESGAGARRAQRRWTLSTDTVTGTSAPASATLTRPVGPGHGVPFTPSTLTVMVEPTRVATNERPAGGCVVTGHGQVTPISVGPMARWGSGDACDGSSPSISRVTVRRICDRDPPAPVEREPVAADRELVTIGCACGAPGRGAIRNQVRVGLEQEKIGVMRQGTAHAVTKSAQPSRAALVAGDFAGEPHEEPRIDRYGIGQVVIGSIVGGFAGGGERFLPRIETEPRLAVPHPRGAVGGSDEAHPRRGAALSHGEAR